MTSRRRRAPCAAARRRPGCSCRGRGRRRRPRARRSAGRPRRPRWRAAAGPPAAPAACRRPPSSALLALEHLQWAEEPEFHFVCSRADAIRAHLPASTAATRASTGGRTVPLHRPQPAVTTRKVPPHVPLSFHPHHRSRHDDRRPRRLDRRRTAVRPAHADADRLRSPDHHPVHPQRRSLARHGVRRRAATSEAVVDLRTPDARDHGEGRGTFNAPDVTVVKVADPAPTGTGFDWGDAGIGAGGLLGLILFALGGTAAVAHRRHPRPPSTVDRRRRLLRPRHTAGPLACSGLEQLLEPLGGPSCSPAVHVRGRGWRGADDAAQPRRAVGLLEHRGAGNGAGDTAERRALRWRDALPPLRPGGMLMSDPLRVRMFGAVVGRSRPGFWRSCSGAGIGRGPRPSSCS